MTILTAYIIARLHAGHVGGQEQRHFPPLGTKLYFHMISSRKFNCIDHQHDHLVTWLQTNAGN